MKDSSQTTKVIEAAMLAAYRAFLIADARNEPAERVEELRARYMRLERQLKSGRTTRRMLAPVLSEGR